MREIPLTKGYWAIVDEEDYEYLMIHKWSVHFGSTNQFRPYARNWKVGMMHRRIAIKIGWDISTKYIHHINGIALDNRRINLLACTARFASDFGRIMRREP